MAAMEDQNQADAQTQDLPTVTVETTIYLSFDWMHVYKLIQARLKEKYPETARGDAVVHVNPRLDDLTSKYLDLFKSHCEAQGFVIRDNKLQMRYLINSAGQVPSTIFEVEALANEVRREAWEAVKTVMENPTKAVSPLSRLYVDPKDLPLSPVRPTDLAPELSKKEEPK